MLRAYTIISYEDTIINGNLLQTNMILPPLSTKCLIYFPHCTNGVWRDWGKCDARITTPKSIDV